MTWFKIDDSFWGHPKRVSTPPAALGVWVTAGSWCAQQLTDGHVPEHMLPMFCGRPKDASDLVRSGLWEKVDDGWQFHDWHDWQPTRAQVQERRDAEAKRKQEWRDKKRSKREKDAGVPAGQTPDATRDSDGTDGGTDAGVLSTRPDPTRPDPTEVPEGTSTSAGPRKRGTRLPDDFAIDADMAAWAHRQGFDRAWVERHTERFADHWRGIPGSRGVKLDWVGTWRNWLRREADDHPPLRGASEPKRPSFWDREVS